MALIRLAYISKATFRTLRSDEGVEPSIARILAASRRNNVRKGIVGGLYYGDGFFFQYLEGEREAVYQTFNRIKSDSRHTDVQIVLEGPVDNVRFRDWSMKYVPLAQEVERLLRHHQLEQFDPYAFSTPMFEELVTLIHAAGGRDSIELSAREGSLRAPPASKQERMERIALFTAAAVLIVGVAAGGLIVLNF